MNKLNNSEFEILNIPFVTVIIPCRNEEKYIDKCLDSIITQDYPKDNLEVLIIDGMSEDGTREIIKKYIDKFSFIKLIDNPEKITPTALNIGIKKSIGDIIFRIDAHAIYPKDYIKKLVYYLEKLGADNVGGNLETLPGNNSIEAQSIAISSSSPFGVGNSKCRLNMHENVEYMEVDTVPFGCYRRELFDRIGFFDEELIRNQDNEFNERIIKHGGKIFLIPSVKIKYYARENYKKLFKMFYQYGYFGPLVDIKLKKIPRLRRIIPLIFTLSLFFPILISPFFKLSLFISLFISIVYSLTNFFFSISEIKKRKEKITLLPYLFFAYFISHISYGLGYLKGILDFFILKKHKKGLSITLSR